MILPPSEFVAELQGYYGSLSIAEKVIQQLWNNLDFETRELQLVTGERLCILDSGKQNKLEGPDFLNARIRVGNKELSGSIEIHLYPADWNRHQHSKDPNYENVILHVTLFDADRVVGEPQNRLVLLSYLREDLESILMRFLLDRSRENELPDEKWLNKFLSLKDCELQQDILLQKAKLRWDQKVRFARQRINVYGWGESCHQYTLEVLGYSRNRVPMHAIALNNPLSELGEWKADELFDSMADQWKLRGSRPSNHPRRRLEAYSRILSKDVHWPLQLAHVFQRYCHDEVNASQESHFFSNIQEGRKCMNIRQLQEVIQHVVCQNEIRGSRIHTLICDAFLPLLSVQLSQDLFALWFLWMPGDVSLAIDQAISHSELNKSSGSVKCNGWIQGLLQLGFETC